MRVERTLLAGAAVAAVLALGSPIAHADSVSAPKAPAVDDQKAWQDKTTAADEVKPDAGKKATSEDPKAVDSKAVDSKADEAKASDAKKDDAKKVDAKKDDAKKVDPKKVDPKADEVKKDEAKKDDKATVEEADASSTAKKPHGGVHTGGGALAVSGGGLASGAALLVGGVGVGAYALRRRTSANGTA